MRSSSTCVALHNPSAKDNQQRQGRDEHRLLIFVRPSDIHWSNMLRHGYHITSCYVEEEHTRDDAFSLSASRNQSLLCGTVLLLATKSFVRFFVTQVSICLPTSLLLPFAPTRWKAMPQPSLPHLAKAVLFTSWQSFCEFGLPLGHFHNTPSLHLTQVDRCHQHIRAPTPTSRKRA